MTRHETFDTKTLTDKDLVLATDLDGTFLGGTDAERARFYAWIEGNRSRIGLIFVTGRDPGFVRDIVRKGDVPRPDYIVADVGTTIAALDQDDHVAPIASLEAEIVEKWGQSSDKVSTALLGVQGLTPQSNVFRHRASYDMDPGQFERRAIDIVEEMGLDALVSDNRFFDVLPKGVSKGPSLERLVAHLGIEASRVLVAGDTLNDLSMLAMGLPGVAVGNSEPALIAQLRTLEHVHLADAHGVAGIAEAILARGMFPAKAA